MNEVTVTIALTILGMAAGALVPVPSAGGRRMDAGYVPVAALPFLAAPAGLGPAEVAGTLAVGVLLRAAVWTVRGDGLAGAIRRMTRETVGFAVWSAVFGLLDAAVGGVAGQVVGLSVGAVAWFGADVAAAVAMTVPPDRPTRAFAARLGLSDVDIFLTLVATGALLGITLPRIGAPWAFVIAGLPYAFAHTSFWRLDATRRTYRQTIRALARIPEVSGLGLPGHAERTARLAVETAKVLGMNPRQVEEVEFAAVMHDLGRITLNEPAVARMGYTDRDIAAWGAEIIGETAYLAGVAEVVRRQHEPYRAPGQAGDPEVPPAARIVRVASAYDRYVAGSGLGVLEALEALHRGTAYEYDPEVVAALRRVLE